ncbi:MAG: hypothetical protein HYV20_02745 [Gemmatimonadetes bacterium]|nr:hypothetical protein [Gemmatimonadota bacterium]
MSRLHPFDVVSGALPEEWFSEIHAAEAQGRDPADRRQFHDLAPARRVLRQLNALGEEATGTTIVEYETLLYAVYRFWRAGRHSLALGREALDRALASGDRARPVPARDVGATPNVPHRACYLQLPERLFWARISDAAPPEPLDGLFLATGAGDREITVLAVLGLRPERGGFSQIAITVPPEDLARAQDFVRRPPFAPVLEGGERAGVKSLVSDAELLHLTHLALAEVGR